MRKLSAIFLALLFLVCGVSVGWQEKDAELLKVRRSVWVAWFAGDVDALKRLVPEDTVTISSGDPKWKHQDDVLKSAADFHAAGGKLVSLEFPKTEVQHFGDVAIVWSDYALEFELEGKHVKVSGRVTEIFVKRNGQWTNPGWHTDSEGPQEPSVS
jgi:ketosteroid isomerase-like protein